MQMAFMYDHLMDLHIGESVMLIGVVARSGATEQRHVCISERHVLLFKWWPF